MFREIRQTIKRNNKHRKITVYQPQLSLAQTVAIHCGELQKIEKDE